jgi:hypothetical protein
MIQPLTISVPLTPTAFHRFAMSAQSEGISLEAYLARISQRGFGVPLDQLMAEVLSDAASAALQPVASVISLPTDRSFAA